MYYVLLMLLLCVNGNVWLVWFVEEFVAGGDDVIVDVCVGDEWYRFFSFYYFLLNKYCFCFFKVGFDGVFLMLFDFFKGGIVYIFEGLNDDNRAYLN